MNFDRLIFGTGCIFLVKIPQGSLRQKSAKLIKQQDIDHAFAVAQLQQHHVSGGLNKVSQIQQQQIRKKVLQEIQTEYDRMKIENQDKLKQKLIQQQKQYKQKIDQIENLRAQQAERLKQQLEKQAKQALKLRTDKQKIQQEIIQFQQLQKKLEQTNIDKQALQQARNALQQKIATIANLQTNLLEIQTKQQQMRQQMKNKQVIIQKELQLKMIICNNQNILNQYKLQLSKKTKNSQELKQLLIKKQRIQLQKQLMQLVPKVQKFNLIAKEMGKNIQSGLSIDYSYISESEVLEILKSNSYKNKLKVSIHVLNKQEKRSYFWNVAVFNNRFQLALSMFEVYIRNQKDPQLKNKETDPYWDPPAPQLIGTTFLSLQPLFYRLQYEGDLSIVRKGDKIGKVHIQIHPTDAKKTVNISEQTMNGISIHNPRDYVQKTLSFCIKFTSLKLEKEYRYSGIKLEYTLVQNSYKNQTQQSSIQQPQQFKYQNYHTLPDLSETIISHYVDQPLPFNFWGQLNEQELDNLTSRDNDTQGELSFLDVKSMTSDSGNSLKKSFGNASSNGSPLKKSFGNSSTSGIIVSNFEVMSKIDQQFQKQKQEMKKKQQQKEKKQEKVTKGKNKDDCNIF